MSSTLPEVNTAHEVKSFNDNVSADLNSLAWTVLLTLASLKVTVVLFAMAIFIVLAGTLAQVDKDIWEVVADYFRTPLAWIDVQIFFPPSFFPSQPNLPDWMVFPFPGGWLIGTAMFVNLLAAHAIRFKIQAKGSRLALGTGVIVLGMLATWLVIASGSNKDGVYASTGYGNLWFGFVAGLVLLWLGMVYAFIRQPSKTSLASGLLLTGIVLLGPLDAWLVYNGDAVQLNDSGMRILWQLLKGTFAGLVLLAGCIMVFRKRAGVVLLHGGIGLMMLSEVLTGTYAVEGQMPIAEGETVNYVMDIRTVELAVVDHSPEKTDIVTVVPEPALAVGNTITSDKLPFDLTVVDFYGNSAVRRIKEGDTNPADAGVGASAIAEPARASTGTDTGSEVDLASAYVTLTDKATGKPIGTYLFSQYLKPQTIKVDGKDYEVELRFQRSYRPFSMHLIDVRKDDYVGTATVKNYSSDLQLVDSTRGVNRKVKIWMNNPLRFAGETFYQSGYTMDPTTGKEVTTLQVVTNAGWMIPYVACMIVAVGMLTHFSIILVRFLNRRQQSERMADEAAIPIDAVTHQPSSAGNSSRLWSTANNLVVPLLVVLLFGGWALSKARVPGNRPDEMDLYEFGELPLVYEGRIKPFDTLARNSLMMISNYQTYKDEAGTKQPAIRWLLDCLADPPAALKHHVIRIDYPELKKFLDLPEQERPLYSLADIFPKLKELQDETAQARLTKEQDPAKLTTFQRKALELEQKIGVFDTLVRSFQHPRIRPESAREDLMAAIGEQQAIAQRHPPLAIPPMGEGAEWEMYSRAFTRNLVQSSMMGKEIEPATEAMSSMFFAYADKDVKRFNQELNKYQKLLRGADIPDLDLQKVDFEAFFNHFAPFYYASILYLVAFVLVAVSWLGFSKPLNSASFWLIAFTLGLHTFALIARIYISGRPPVTNLYSSAVFIGWGAVVLGMILEMVYRLGIGNVIAAVAGFAALGIAHFLALVNDGDTFVVLQAVLDTQFWLATHVVCITLGYATTYVAGLLGVLYVLRGVLTPTLTPAIGKSLARMIYGTLCFAIFFSFVGTVLGGLWADDSWGRFWGWDPKENGALIIVLWNALILHARWDGMVKDRGLANLAVAGNICTAWSWFGVNELGVGLHSSGFTEGVLLALGLFVLSQLAIIGLGCIPKDRWWSFQRHASEPVG